MAAAPLQASQRVQLVTSVDELVGLREPYEALLARVPDGLGFWYQIEQLRAAAPWYLGARRSLHFLLVWDEQALLSAWPLVLCREAWSRLSRRRLLPWGWVANLRLRTGGRVLAADPQSAARGLLACREYLFGPGAGDFDLIDIPYVRATPMGAQRLLEALPGATCAVEEMKTYTIELPASFAGYCAATFSTATLRKIQKNIESIRRSHELVLRETSRLTPDELARVIEIHNARQTFLAQRGESRNRFFESTDERDLILAQLEAAAQSAQARHYLLEIDGHTIGFDLCFNYQGVLFAYLTAFDDSARRYAPGRVMALLIAEREIERHQTRRIDLDEGETVIKRNFANGSIENWHVSLVNPSSRVSQVKCAALSIAGGAKRAWAC